MKKNILFLSIILLLFTAGPVFAVSQDAIQSNMISPEYAYDIARSTLLEFILSGSPGLDPTLWYNATVSEEPVCIYDINNEILFYQFDVLLGTVPNGTIKIGASRVLPSSVMTIGLTPAFWKQEGAEELAIDNLFSECPDCTVISILPVCYNYPKIGERIEFLQPESAYTNQYIFDIATKTRIENSSVRSFYDQINDESILANHATWDEEEKIHALVLNEAQNLDYFDYNNSREEKLQTLHQILIDYMGNSSVNSDIKTIKSSSTQMKSGEKTLRIMLRPQETNYYCAVATIQMIAEYYGQYYSQNYIATMTNTGPYGTLVQPEINFYKNYLGKKASYEDKSPTFNEEKNEIVNSRPFDSSVYSGTIVHARVGAGYNDDWGQQNIYIFDPWPPNVGDIYWESFSQNVHYSDVFAVDTYVIPTPIPTTVPTTIPTTIPTTVLTTQPTIAPSQYNINAITSGMGTIHPAGLIAVYAGSSQTFSINPDPGNKIDRVVVDGVNIGAVGSYSFNNIQSDHSINAYFTAGNQPTISPTPTQTSLPTTPITTVSTTTPTIIPTATPTTIRTTSPTTVPTTVQPTLASEYTITAIPDQNGIFSPAGLVKVAAGASQQFFIIPMPGYKIDRVIVDGINKGSVNMYTFNDVYADHILNAYFIEENQQSNQITFPLEPGWNLISTPKSLKEGFDTIDSVIGTTDTDNHSIYLYDASTGKWLNLKRTSKVTPLVGIWVYSNSKNQAIFVINDITEKPSKSIYLGWNAVGCTVLDQQSVKENFNSINDIWTSTIGFNAVDQLYETSLINGGTGTHSDSTILVPGKGYWVYSTSTGTLIEN